MTESPQFLVDTNVIVDVLHADPDWLPWSKRQLERFAEQLLINPFIYSEICYHADNQEDVDSVVQALALGYKELTRRALFLAAKAYQRYRRKGGVKTAPLADFFIGAHAEAAGLTLITRDKGRYGTCFTCV